MSALSAVLIAGGATLVGVLFCAAGGDELTRTFSVFYLAGCIVATLLVRYRGLFTAVVQPPLILFVAVPVAYQFMADDGGTSPKDIALNAAIPLVNRFPLMLFTTLVTLLIGGWRVYLKRSAPAIASERRSREQSTPRTTAQPETAPSKTSKAKTSQTKTSQAKTAARRTTRGGSTRTTESVKPPGTESSPSGRQRTETPHRVQRPTPTPAEPPTRNPQQHPPNSASAQAVRTPSARSMPEVPVHPLPQVRYRNREGMANEA